MLTRRGVPPRGVLILAGTCAALACGFAVITTMSLGMTRDPDVPSAFAWLVVSVLALCTALLAWTTWGVLRGRTIIAERLLARDDSISGMIEGAIIQRLLGSDEAREWFGLPAPTRRGRGPQDASSAPRERA